jgi:Sugar phosphate isomerases/epimerases
MFIPGIVSATFKGRPWEDVISFTSANGLKAIEWSENHHVPFGDTEKARLMGEKTREAGLKIASYGSYYRLGKGMDIQPSLENAKAMGAKVVRIWAGEKPSSEVGDDEFSFLAKEARDAAHKAEAMGLVLATEWHKNTLTDTNEMGLRLLKAVDSPAFKTFWQPTMALSVPERVRGIEMIKDWLLNVHVYYWDEAGRQPLIDGKGDWAKYLAAMGEEERYLLLEFVKKDEVAQAEEDAATLISWI